MTQVITFYCMYTNDKPIKSEYFIRTQYVTYLGIVNDSHFNISHADGKSIKWRNSVSIVDSSTKNEY